jgi:putative ABC transport system substrate-binding protein
MRRRDFLSVLGGVAAAWPLAARSQQPAIPMVEFLSSRSPGEAANLVAAFRQGLRETGHVEGQNVVIEYRWAEGQAARLPAMAAELVRRPVAVIAATGGPGPALATKQLTSTIPLVFIGNDPVRAGLVTSLNRPGGNATGVNVFLQEMESKRLGLLRELVPTAPLIAVLIYPSGQDFDLQLKDIEDSARTLGQRIHVLRATSQHEIDTAFTTLAELKPGALLVCASPFFNNRREQIVALANHYKIPTIYEVREYVLAGGLMSYGTNLPDAYRQVGIYTGRILKGEKPGELPVFQMTKFEFVINLKAARALGIDVPGALSARADEVIE